MTIDEKPMTLDEREEHRKFVLQQIENLLHLILHTRFLSRNDCYPPLLTEWDGAKTLESQIVVLDRVKAEYKKVGGKFSPDMNSKLVARYRLLRGQDLPKSLRAKKRR